MRPILICIALLLLLPLAYSQDACSNKVQDSGEEGVDCGLACGTSCFPSLGENIPTPGVGAKQETPPVPTVTAPVQEAEVPTPPSPPTSGQQATSQPVAEVIPAEGQQTASQPIIEETPTEASAVPVGKATAYNITQNVWTLTKYSLYLLLLLGGVVGAYYMYSSYSTTRTIDYNPELLNYIKLCQAKNIKKEQIYQKLLSSGYEKAEIEYHFKQM